MNLFLADAINFPMVLMAGIVVLVPLMAFEVFVEALVLKRIWRVPYGQLCTLAFVANCWSLLAGIPVKMLNTVLYAQLVPNDIPGFFARYPFATAIGSLTYFTATILVEGTYALRWRKQKNLALGPRRVWRAIVLANIATYAVLAPLHYYATRPACQLEKMSRETQWSSQPAEKVLFVDGADGHLKSIQVNGAACETIVPVPTRDYLVSTNLAVCLFRGTNGNLYLYRRERGEPELIWKTAERFFMDQVAFSPSGGHVAFASEKEHAIEVMEMASGKRMRLSFTQQPSLNGLSVGWSLEETKLFLRGLENGAALAITIRPEGELAGVALDGTNPPPHLKCYGRTGTARWWGGGDWGVSFHQDTHGGLTAASWPGLDSSLVIEREAQKAKTRILTISVRPGWLHLAGFYFGDVGFLADGHECLFEANGYIYLLNVEEKHLGTLVKGERFVQLTPHFEKQW